MKNITHKKLLSFLVIFMTTVCYCQAQTVSIENSSYTSNDLVNSLLQDGCMQVSNVTLSSNLSVANFQNNGGSFPIAEGVVIRSGNVMYTEGEYTGNNLSSQVNNEGDNALQEINDSSGQISTITDVAYLSFDFIPLSSSFNFDFLFASNEYGQWQCVSSDVFAFLLTDLNTGETTNLAMIPNTDIPISVKNIRDEEYNNSCSSQHENLFSTYNVGNTESTINMRGYTKVMNASSGLIPGTPYRIKLVIGDSNDADYDSAIFLAAGSFNTNLDLGPDLTLCEGDETVIQTNLSTSEYTHVWTLDGNTIANELENSLAITQTGNYGVIVTKTGTTCVITDELNVTDLEVETPQDLTVCNTGEMIYHYDLSQNNAANLGLNPENYQAVFYANSQNMQTNTPIPSNNITNYASNGNQTIYLKIRNLESNNFCTAEYSFNLQITEAITVNTPADIEVCYSPGGNDLDFSQLYQEILPNANMEDYNILFFLTQTNAANNTGAINPLNHNFPANAEPQTIWVRIENISNSNCYTLVSFNLIEHPLPPVSTIPYVVECSEYTLPEIEHGTYYTEPNGPNGNGEALQPGDVITQGGVYFIFSGPDENGCVNQSSFDVDLIISYEIDEIYCGEFTVPIPPAGNYYTAPHGPNGTGELLPGETVLTTSQNIYFYAEIDGEPCRDTVFPITILPLPEVDELEDVVTCDSYILPEITHGNYHTAAGGNGNILNAGDSITASRLVYIFADDGTCVNQSSFQVTIIPNYEDVTACGSYELPPLEAGGYFTAPSGSGEQIPEETLITSTQEIYIFAQTTTGYNCTENLSINITIIPIPPVDSLEDVLLCEEETYALPSIENGQYFTNPERQGEQLFPGDLITQTQSIYINNLENGCENETSFSVEIIELPFVEIFTDVYTCEPYVLPTPSNGVYYTEPGGTGSILQPGEIITETQMIYLYNNASQLSSCYNEQAFTIYVMGISLEEVNDVFTCDSYTLPSLNAGNYYSESGGNGTQLPEGAIITENQTIYIYAISGERFICESEESFAVNITETPVLPNFEDIVRCESYELPILSNENYDVAYYWDPNGENEIPLDNYILNIPGTYTIYVYATAINNLNCYVEKSFTVTINPLQTLILEDSFLCVDPETGKVESSTLFESGLNPEDFIVDWYFKGNLVHTGPSYEANQVGEYTVITTKVGSNNGTNCNYNPTIVHVEKSSRPIIKTKVNGDFSDNASITIEIIHGFGNYEYQLDNNPFQTENVFKNVPSGIHKVTVRDIKGECGTVSVEVNVLNYPKFFTPNNDGHNDTWNIWDLKTHPEAVVHIFNRYGKLLTSLNPTRTNGWDGSYNGKLLPSDDYWFNVLYTQNGVQRSFKSNFTLKR